MDDPRDPRVWLGPDCPAALLAPLERAGVLSRSPEAANAFVWTEGPDGISECLHPDIRWVQLISAGVETWVSARTLDPTRTWTSASHAFGERVAEHALALILASAKNLAAAIRSREWRDTLPSAILSGCTVGLIGAGAIGQATLKLLAPFGVRRIALTRSGRTVVDAELSLQAEALDQLLEASDFVVVAAPLTEATTALIGPHEIALIGPNGYLINVARGALVDTEALVEALRYGRLAGAALDVTAPEPLPLNHPLWSMRNVIITPHIANPPATHFEALAPLVMENIDRFRRGAQLIGVIDPPRGY